MVKKTVPVTLPLFDVLVTRDDCLPLISAANTILNQLGLPAAKNVRFLAIFYSVGFALFKIVSINLNFVLLYLYRNIYVAIFQNRIYQISVKCDHTVVFVKWWAVDISQHVLKSFLLAAESRYFFFFIAVSVCCTPTLSN